MRNKKGERRQQRRKKDQACIYVGVTAKTKEWKSN